MNIPIPPSSSVLGLTSEEVIEGATTWLSNDGYLIGKSIVLALLIFVIGKWIARVVRNKIQKSMNAREVDPALVSFGTNIIYYVLMIAIILAAVQQLGFQTTSLVAVLGAAGLAVGLALGGSLSNFASGVLIIMFRPFKIGDFIDAGGQSGVVQEIGVLVTILKSPDNKKIIQPNSAIMSGSIINVTANDTRRVDMAVGVSYSDDLDKVQNVILDVLNADERILKDPAPQVVVAELADSSVNFNVRPWCATGDYWGVFFDFQKAIKQRLDKEGVSIPFPQQDVYMHQVNEKTETTSY